MGDHRASIKIVMDAHGKTYSREFWINWSPDDSGCDWRITDWFAECWADAYARFDAENADARRAEEAAESERRDREEYARLKAKFDPGAF